MIMAIPAVLRSQDCLSRPYNSQYESFTSVAVKPRRTGLLPTPNSNHNPNPNRPRRRKRSPQVSPDRTRGQDRSLVAKFPSKNLVMEHVKILKRGEDMITPPSMKKKTERLLGKGDLVLCSTDRLGPEPETVQKQVRVPEVKVSEGIYAGSAAFFASPPPSSLPLPAFCSKKQTNDTATTDLRRLLRLDLA